MGFTDLVILFDGFNEPVGIDNNTPTISADVKIDLKSNQDFQFARIFLQVCQPGSLFGSAFRVEFNGKTLGSQTWPPFEGGCKEIDVPVTNLMRDGKNTLKVHLDARLQSFEFLVSGNLFYELNTEEPPNDVDISDPEEDKGLGDVVKIAIPVGIGIAAVVAVAVLVGNLAKLRGR